ncbi:prefolding complex chaperone subunit CYBJADRAFT_179100 [Cyberlindnera jadinii NRRL Y-1542]|uniref:Prefoldin n=1 Tax=Cyberlindnera jadinii (strain ATCC 18201 / CBS 1600 / BCRC 20928 / JCM 3617 / NBRC 0987 / NRRL Y-1542) TaxID=983966 RepID=A0A1E4S972_CYBJN|nr:hypothetical protein CYBJADRAFT_179100 [Cyberlindnera jadinii NRRL Y-1542]ODV76034.1 hypothetical protein CYBJADRAFT_179100 [Cyberlindnera jadinii NRRL Y-1542]
MSMSEGQLQNLLQELSASHQQYTAQLQATLGSLRTVARDEALLKATQKELGACTKAGDSVWSGVGKMFLKTPIDEYTSELGNKSQELSDRQSALEKKKDYLEISVSKTQDSLKQILGGAKK